MNAENVRINLRYDRADLKSLLRYAKAHDVESRWTVRHTETASPEHLDAQLDFPRLPGRVVVDVQLGVRLEHLVVDVGHLAARLRLGDIPRRIGEVRNGGIGRHSVRQEPL